VQPTERKVTPKAASIPKSRIHSLLPIFPHTGPNRLGLHIRRSRRNTRRDIHLPLTRKMSIDRIILTIPGIRMHRTFMPTTNGLDMIPGAMIRTITLITLGNMGILRVDLDASTFGAWLAVDRAAFGLVVFILALRRTTLPSATDGIGMATISSFMKTRITSDGILRTT
jgi:hypothetical protein